MRTTIPWDFYALVSISHVDVLDEVAGCRGIIMGRAEDGLSWSYSVRVLGLEDEGSFILPHDKLTPTGKVFRRSDLYGSSVRVFVDNDGKGHIEK